MEPDKTLDKSLESYNLIISQMTFEKNHQKNQYKLICANWMNKIK